jgi:hypothetical protein
MPSDDQRLWPKAASGAELDNTLTIAERLLEQADRGSERCRVVRIVEFGVVGLAIFVITGWDGLDRLAGWPRLTAVSLIGAAIGASLAALIYLLLESPLRRRLARDTRAAVQISQLIRELLPLVAREENWNELQLDVFKSRLSRFPIDPRGIR